MKEESMELPRIAPGETIEAYKETGILPDAGLLVSRDSRGTAYACGIGVLGLHRGLFQTSGNEMYPIYDEARDKFYEELSRHYDEAYERLYEEFSRVYVEGYIGGFDYGFDCGPEVEVYLAALSKLDPPIVRYRAAFLDGVRDGQEARAHKETLKQGAEERELVPA